MVSAFNPPRVSAIIVVLNGEAYLGEAIDSVLGQTLTEWELIVVDDGSTDRTGAIVLDYIRRHPGRIRLASHPDGVNRGIAASRNLGVGLARGQFIAFLDADDIWLPNKLADQTAVLDADPTLGLVYGRTLIWHSWDRNAQRDDFYYPLGVVPNGRYEPPTLFELLLENRSQTPTTCNAMIRAEFLRSLGGFEDEFRGMFEDQTFFARALAVCPAYVSDKKWAKYRQHSVSCTSLSRIAGRDHVSRLRFLIWLSATLDATRKTRQIRRAIRGAYWRTIYLIAKDCSRSVLSFSKRLGSPTAS